MSNNARVIVLLDEHNKKQMSFNKWLLKKKKVDTFLQTPFLRTFFALPVPVFFRELHSKNSIGVYTLQVIIVEHF